MGEKDVIFNPSITDDALVSDVLSAPSGLYDDLGNPIAQ